MRANDIKGYLQNRVEAPVSVVSEVSDFLFAAWASRAYAHIT